MERWPRFAGAVLIAALLAGCQGGGSVLLPAKPAAKHHHVRQLSAPLGLDSIVGLIDGLTDAISSLCVPIDDPLRASCLGTVRMASSTTSAFPDSVAGLTPKDLSSIYGYPTPAMQGPTNQVVGVVVAYDYPAAESDLATYRSYYGLPACTSRSGCFRKIGAAAPAPSSPRAPAAIERQSISAHPTTNASGWAAETAADIETISAVCPNCKIVLAEAASDNLADLGQAVQAAVQAHATIVNASFGATEDYSQTNLESQFEPAGVKVVAAAGDSGRQALFPAAATNVIAVAGTTLNVSGTTVSESLWSKSGGGCSSVFGAAWYQPSPCYGRSIADVAAVGDPNTGLAFYDSSYGGWGIVGGTSVSAPIIAAMYALSGDTAAGTGASRLYANPASFTPVQNDGNLAGLGTPNDLTGF